MKEGIIKLVVNDEEKECSIIFSFEKNNKNYIVYTDNEVDEDGFIKTYVGEYQKLDDEEKLIPVQDEKILIQVEKLLEKIDGEDSK